MLEAQHLSELQREGGGQGGQRSVGFHSKTRICIMTHVTTYSWLYLDIILQDVEVLVGEVLRNVSEHS